MKHNFTWTELKALNLKKKANYQFFEKEGFYNVFIEDAGIVFECEIDKDGPRNTDQIDFEDNYKSLANKPTHPSSTDQTPYVRVTEKPVGEMLQIKGFDFTCAANDTTDYYAKWDEAISFTGARAKIFNASTGVAFGDFDDRAEMQIVDKDNILGYGAGLVITEFGKGIGGKILEWGCVSETTTAASLAIGLYIRIRYYNSGATEKRLQGVFKYYH